MEKKLNFKQKLFVIFLDVIILAELTASLYWANGFGESMTSMFLKTYLPVVFLTLALGKYCLTKLECAETAAEKTDQD